MLSAVMLMGIAICGCRDTEPPPRLYRDLGEGTRPLLPTPTAWVDASVRSGRADWVPFPDPQEAAAPVAGGAEAPAAAGAAGSVEQGRVEKQIRDTIAEYNRALSEERFEDLPTFFIESQAKVIGQLTEVLPAIVAKLGELNQALPEQNEMFAQALDQASLEKSLKLELSTVAVAGPSEVTGTLASGRSIRFELADDGYWYIDLPALEGLASSLPMMSQSTQQLDQLIEAVKSGGVPADAVADQLGGLMQMVAPLAAGDAEPTAPTGDAGPEEAVPPSTPGGG